MKEVEIDHGSKKEVALGKMFQLRFGLSDDREASRWPCRKAPVVRAVAGFFQKKKDNNNNTKEAPRLESYGSP